MDCANDWLRASVKVISVPEVGWRRLTFCTAPSSEVVEGVGIAIDLTFGGRPLGRRVLGDGASGLPAGGFCVACDRERLRGVWIST